MLTIKDDSLRYYTISYAIFNQLSYLITSSGQMLSECVCVCVCGGWGTISPIMGKRRSTDPKCQFFVEHVFCVLCYNSIIFGANTKKPNSIGGRCKIMNPSNEVVTIIRGTHLTYLMSPCSVWSVRKQRQWREDAWV